MYQYPIRSDERKRYIQALQTPVAKIDKRSNITQVQDVYLNKNKD